jgi:hypothetical protein
MQKKTQAISVKQTYGFNLDIDYFLNNLPIMEITNKTIKI